MKGFLGPTPDRKAIIFMGFIVGGCLLLGTGINMALINQGIVKTKGTKVPAIVQSCPKDALRCTVTYQLNGIEHTSQYGSTNHSYASGAHVGVTVYPGQFKRVFPENEVPLALAILVIGGGTLLSGWACVKLFRFWKHEGVAAVEDPAAASSS